MAPDGRFRSLHHSSRLPDLREGFHRKPGGLSRRCAVGLRSGRVAPEVAVARRADRREDSDAAVAGLAARTARARALTAPRLNGRTRIRACRRRRADPLIASNCMARSDRPKSRKCRAWTAPSRVIPASSEITGSARKYRNNQQIKGVIR